MLDSEKAKGKDRAQSTPGSAVRSWLKPNKRPDLMLVIDTETATLETLTMSGFDPERWPWQSQRLLFGRAMLAIRDVSGRYVPEREWLFYPDDLPEEGQDRLISGIDALRMGTDYEPNKAPYTRLSVISLSQFLRLFYDLVCKRGALVVGFNLAYDITRIARYAAPAKGKWRNGFSLSFWQHGGKASKYTPRLRMKHIDAKRTLYSWSVPGLKLRNDGKRTKQKRLEPNILDMKTLIFALTSEQHSLKSAAEKYLELQLNKDMQHGVITPQYVEYNRQDVLTTLDLANHFLKEFDKHPISVTHGGMKRETQMYSPASLAKSYLQSMGVQPRRDMQAFPEELMGAAMAAYYGGRTEVFVRKVSVPVVHLDFMSMYPTVNTLMGLWQLVIAKEVRAIEATDDVVRQLAELTLDDCFDKENWPRFVGIAEVEPDGDILPVRAKYGNTWNIGLNPYHSGAQWYAIPDLIASKLLTGKAPKVLRAYRFMPVGVQDGLKPVKLMGVVPVDPCSQDFFRLVIEERRKVKSKVPPYDVLSDGERDTLQSFLKILANAGSYGIYMEIVPEELQKPVPLRVHSNSHFVTKPMDKYERPGPYFFAPMASMITSAARLMLAVLESCVRDAGGIHVLSDTDSMMVIADKARHVIEVKGAGKNDKPIHQRITALSWHEVYEIVARFAALNPYAPDVMQGSVLEVKETNFDENQVQRRIWCYAVSSKRYCLFDNEKHLIDFKESGLGFLMNPLANKEENRKLAHAFYEAVIRGERYSELQWARLPCVRQLALTTVEVLRQFARHNEGKPYDQSIKPHNFLMTVTLQSEQIGGQPVRLVAPLDTDPESWWQLEWLNSHRLGDYWQLTEDVFGVRNRKVAEPKLITEFLTQYLWHPEHPFLGADGLACGGETKGVLQRRPIARNEIKVTGKEGIDIEEAEHDLLDLEEWPRVYHPDEAQALRLALDVIRELPQADVAQAMSVSTRQINYWLSGEDVPSNRRALIAYARDYARKALNGRSDMLGDVEVLLAYQEWRVTLIRECRVVISSMSTAEIKRVLNITNGSFARKVREGQLPALQTLQKWLPALANYCRAKIDLDTSDYEAISRYARACEALTW